MHRKLYLSILAAFATVAAIVLFAMLAAPVASPFALALIIGISTMPHYNRLLRRFPGHPARCAGIMVFAILVCIILPTAALVVTATINASDWYNQIVQLISTLSKTGVDTLRHLPLVDRASAIAHRFGVDFAGVGGKVAASASEFLVGVAAAAAKNLLDLLFTLFVALFILFFVYRDGERVVNTCIARLAPNKKKAARYVAEIRSITTAVTVGTLFTCAAQGVTAGIGYYVAGLPAPIFCGALTAMAALLPVVGTGVIWVPLTAVLALNGSYLHALLLAAYCMIFVGMADNAIRPLAIGAASDIPVLAIVIGAICGVVTMGLLGLILGPVIFAILMTIWGQVMTEDDQDEDVSLPAAPPK
ncbi:AI-2E family transporter [Geomonas sp.]|uniref:AI-2E family transporter n=1 Tax=Geomonas sp. TaxID=2651584 RepID=UPI002B4697AC|nr:AI-2E family transporter [Geomonas sp.]HJV34146.1 AI-2E family transporter [Geomonas sp.]